MQVFRVCVAALARFLMSLFFLVQAIQNIFCWREAESRIMNLLYEWQTHAGIADPIHEWILFLTPWSFAILGVCVFLSLTGGLLLLLGIRERLGAFFLFLFLLLLTCLQGPFWDLEGFAREQAMTDFLKNLALLGSLLLILLHGAQGQTSSST